MLLNDCRMRFRFDETRSIAIGWIRSANHFCIYPLFLVSILTLRINYYRRSLQHWTEAWCAWYFPELFFMRPWTTNLSLAAMHNKKKISEKIVSAEQSYYGRFVNNLEQLSHIAIVSFTRALLSSLVPFLFAHAELKWSITWELK